VKCYRKFFAVNTTKTPSTTCSLQRHCVPSDVIGNSTSVTHSADSQETQQEMNLRKDNWRHGGHRCWLWF